MIALVLTLAAWLPSSFEEAERAYRDGDFAVAQELFTALLAEPGVADGPVLFNLGNCSYRLGRRAEAVWYYRRAQRRLPNDLEVAFNLRLAERELGIAVVPPSVASALTGWLDGIPAGWSCVLVVLLQGVGLVGLLVLRRGHAVRPIAALSVLVGVLVAARLAYVQVAAAGQSGVVLAREIVLRTEPHRDLTITGRLGAGESVRVEEGSERWVRITHPRGAGWTQRSGIGIVD